MNQTVLHLAVFLLMLIQSIISLVFPVYLDQGWIKDTWFGNDLVTLAIVCPLFLFSILKKSNIFKLIRLGCLGYVIYNYAFYLLGTSINKLFIIYILLITLGIISIIQIFSTDIESKFAYNYFDDNKKYIISSLIFLIIGIGLGSVWIGSWISHSFFNGRLPVEESSFRLVASLDLVIIVNMMLISGIALLKKKMIGFITGTIIGIQGSLYLLILTVNSIVITINQDKISSELPIWGLLFIITLIGIISLLLIGRKKS